jgi:hypothetical protein
VVCVVTWEEAASSLASDSVATFSVVSDFVAASAIYLE